MKDGEPDLCIIDGNGRALPRGGPHGRPQGREYAGKRDPLRRRPATRVAFSAVRDESHRLCSLTNSQYSMSGLCIRYVVTDSFDIQGDIKHGRYDAGEKSYENPRNSRTLGWERQDHAAYSRQTR